MGIFKTFGNIMAGGKRQIGKTTAKYNEISHKASFAAGIVNLKNFFFTAFLLMNEKTA